MVLSDLLGDAWKDGMTLEEVTEALKGVEMPADQSAEIERLKNSLSKSNSEAADWKRKYRETQDADKRKAEEDSEAVKKLTEELNDLRRTNSISSYKATYLAMGYSEKDAADIAEAMADGKTDVMLDVQKRHQEAYAEKLKKELLKGTPRPGGSDGDDDDKGKNANVELAKKLAKESAGNTKQASDIMKLYTH